MRKYCLSVIFLLMSLALFSNVVFADDVLTDEATVPASAEETSFDIPDETTFFSSSETGPVTTEVSTLELSAAGSEEGSSYKGVPWGADFNTFKTIKNFAGNLGSFSASFVSSASDNDIALLLGVPVSDPQASGGQRVRFEYVPRKFASVYLESDDIYYIFYNGKFAMTFSRINEENFDLYRDTFYKKYQKTGYLAKRYEPVAKQSYLFQAGTFMKGKTEAFLIKSQLTTDKKTFVSTKLVFASSVILSTIRKEINDKLAADQLSTGEKHKQELEKDLQKIE